MYSVKLSIENQDKSEETAFDQAANQYLASLKNEEDLRVLPRAEKSAEARGDLPLWADIVITGVSTGAFMTIYMLAKDFFAVYANAEVQLIFDDGSSIKLKHLTEKEAEAKLREHIQSKSSENIEQS